MSVGCSGRSKHAGRADAAAVDAPDPGEPAADSTHAPDRTARAGLDTPDAADTAAFTDGVSELAVPTAASCTPCDDANACTVDVCLGAGKCLHDPIDALCDDGLPCTADRCAAAGCLHEPRPEGALCPTGCLLGRCKSGACGQTQPGLWQVHALLPLGATQADVADLLWSDAGWLAVGSHSNGAWLATGDAWGQEIKVLTFGPPGAKLRALVVGSGGLPVAVGTQGGSVDPAP